MKLGRVVEVVVEAGPHPHAFITTLPSTNAERPAIVSELQVRRTKEQIYLGLAIGDKE